METLLLEKMTWPEIRDAMAEGYDTVVIFAASIEQHGPGLPEVTDTALGYFEAEDLARRLGKALAAPVIRPGLSAHHMGFPGSITLRPEIFKGIVEDYVTAYVCHGFRKIVLCSSHGGNFRTLEEVAREQSEKFPEVCIVTGVSLEVLDETLIEMDRMEGQPPGTCGGHACDWETSLMLLIDENYVRRDKLEKGCVEPLQGELLEKFFNEGVGSVSPIGVMGDPTNADKERGRRYFEYLQKIQADCIREKIAAWEKDSGADE